MTKIKIRLQDKVNPVEILDIRGQKDPKPVWVRHLSRGNMGKNQVKVSFSGGSQEGHVMLGDDKEWAGTAKHVILYGEGGYGGGSEEWNELEYEIR